MISGKSISFVNYEYHKEGMIGSMLNIGNYGKFGAGAPVGQGRNDSKGVHGRGGKNKDEKKDAAKKSNIDRAEFSSFTDKPGKTEGINSGLRVGAAAQKTDELSDTAKEYLEKLKKKFGNMDFIIADYSTDEEADELLSKGNGEYNVLITPDLLEKMAAEESVATEYEGIIQSSVDSIEQIREGLGDDADMVDRYGVTVSADGTFSIHAKLIEGLVTDDGSDTVKANTVDEMLEALKAAKESQAEKLEELREKRRSQTTADTDDADNEVRKLKDSRQKLVSQIRAEHNDDKRSELEDMLSQLDTELAQKDNDAYRRSHTHFSTSV